MIKHQPLFKSLIKCNTCGYAFTKITERGKIKYICSGYRNKKSNCERVVIPESELLTLVKGYTTLQNIHIEETNLFMKSLIDKILIDNKEVKVFYKNGHVTTWNEQCLKF